MQVLDILRGCIDPMKKYILPALLLLAMQMIARLDDTAHLRKNTLMVCPEFDFALSACMRWSKNVSDERDAPRQIMLGSMNAKFDILLAFGVALHVMVDCCEGEFGEFVFCPGSRKPQTMKANYYRMLKDNVLDAPEFNRKFPGPLGTHSTRKYGMTRCRRNGCHKDEGDYRGRFKAQKRVSDRYCDITLPWVDVKTNVALCIDGACAYVLKEGSGITDAWICEFVCPSIRRFYSDGVAALLGKAVLWAMFDSDHMGLVPQAWRHIVMAEYNKIPAHHRIADGENPVAKRRCVAWEQEGIPHIDIINEEDDGDASGVGGGRLGSAEASAQMSAVHNRMCSLERKQDELRDEYRENQRQTMDILRKMERNMSRIAAQPVVRPVRLGGIEVGVAGGGDEGIPYAVTLSPNPNNLFILWQEYEHGIGGRKAARYFTREERGHKKVKYTYCNRKKVWDLVDKMIRSGYTADSAIDKIYTVYGPLSVTKIIKQIRNDEPNGGVPQLS